MQHWRFILVAFVALTLGWLAGYFGPNWFTIELKKEIGLGDVFNFFLAVAFAILFQSYLTKRFGDDRAEKDHILSLIQDGHNLLKELRGAVHSSFERVEITESDRYKITALSKGLGSSLWLLDTTMKQCKVKEEAAAKEIKDLYFSYKRSVSGGGFPSETYSLKAISESDKAYGKITRKLVALRARVNRR